MLESILIMPIGIWILAALNIIVKKGYWKLLGLLT